MIWYNTICPCLWTQVDLSSESDDEGEQESIDHIRV
jgi:hypothetical protein